MKLKLKNNWKLKLKLKNKSKPKSHWGILFDCDVLYIYTDEISADYK